VDRGVREPAHPRQAERGDDRQRDGADARERQEDAALDAPAAPEVAGEVDNHYKKGQLDEHHVRSDDAAELVAPRPRGRGVDGEDAVGGVEALGDLEVLFLPRLVVVVLVRTVDQLFVLLEEVEGLGRAGAAGRRGLG